MTKTCLIYLTAALTPLLWQTFSSPPWHKSLGQSVLDGFSYPLYMGFALVGFLGWKLNQTRILFSSMLFIGIAYAMNYPNIFSSWNIDAAGLNQIVSLALPLTLVIIFSLRESRFMDTANLKRLGWSLVPLALLILWRARGPVSFGQIATLEIIPLPAGFLLPQIALIFFLLYFVGVAMEKDKKIKPFILATGITMIPLLSAAREGMVPHGFIQELFSASGPTLHNVMAFAVICGIQLHAIFKMYWQRVYQDELTGIGNRRALDEYLASLSGEYALAMMDIDHFKAFNDTYGHDEGDNVLRMVGGLLHQELGDKVYRYGGEEFCAVFKGFGSEDAFMFANKVRRKLEERVFHIRKTNSKKQKSSKSDRKKIKTKGKKVQVTISVGLASPYKSAKDPSDVLKLADQALYEAKDQGRNCVVIWES